MIKTCFAPNLTSWEMSPELEKMLGPIEKDIKDGKNINKFISSPEELDEVLETHGQLYHE